MSAFTRPELDYLLGDRRLARLATVGRDGTPHVVPVGWRYNPDEDAIDVGGRDPARTTKYRHVHRTGRAAIVIDDLASIDPWRPRGIEVRGNSPTRSLRHGLPRKTLPARFTPSFDGSAVAWQAGRGDRHGNPV
jgi:pyridoxamine 5'-phosphate oxidase family protein